MTPARVAVVGGGISGVAAAYFLKKLGLEPEIIEAEDCLGGRAGSTQLGDKNIDIGGKNIGRRYQLFRQFAADHGSPPFEFFGINSSSVQDGVLRTIDSEKKLLSLYHLLRLVGPKDFARLARLAVMVKRSPDEALLGAPWFSQLSERRDHQPLSSWFGVDAIDNFLRPITVRMNGAEPDECYLGCFGSNIKMVLDKYDQLQFGMGDLLQRFARTVEVSLNTRVRGLRRGKRGYRLLLEHADHTSGWRDYDYVVLALPAPLSAELLPSSCVAEKLCQVAYYPVTLVVAEYTRPIFDSRVRAIVFDKESELSNAGCYGPENLEIVRYTFSGRKARGALAEANAESIVELGEQTLSRHVPVAAHERTRFVYRHFERGLCAYAPFHHRLLKELYQWESTSGGIALTGDYFYGASIEACFQAGLACARRVTAALDLIARETPQSLDESEVVARTAQPKPNSLPMESL